MTLVEIAKVIRENKVNEAYARIQKDIEFLVMATPTGKAREELTTARMFIDRAKQHAGRARG